MTDHTPPAEQQRLLARVDILEQLPPEEVGHLALRSTSVRLGAGEAVALDESWRSILLLVSGRARVHESGTGDQDLTLSMAEGGTVIGQTGFAPRRARVLRVEALEPSVVHSLAWDDLEDLVFRNPKVGVKTIRLLSERLAVCEGRLSEMVRKEVPARLAGLILGLSEHQGVVTSDGMRRIPTRFTHHQLASMVGSNREAVTRAFGRLRNAGAVEIRHRHICVTDADALERLAEAGR
jgi:CRP/FNR family cyclic AMP-dependent transcriptional regulator